jgi:hypothetical protein
MPCVRKLDEFLRLGHYFLSRTEAHTGANPGPADKAAEVKHVTHPSHFRPFLGPPP